MYITANLDSEFCWQKFFFVDHPPTILFNGEEVKACFEADDEKGFIVTPRYDFNGNVMIDHFGNVETARFNGKVEIKGGIRRED